MVWSHFREVNFNFRIMDRMLGILKDKMSLEYPTFETAFESGLETMWRNADMEMQELGHRAHGSHALFHVRELHGFELVFRGTQ